MKDKIHIVGAGPAGMVAGINLKRQGFDVLIHEAEKEVGGPPGWHPSVHVDPIDYDVFEEYTGVDIRPAFKDVTDYMTYYYENEERPFADFIGTIPNMQICVRGPHPTSLDTYLYELAVKEGVEFLFNDKWGKEQFYAAPPNTIVSTGFGQSAYEALGMRFTPFYGYWTRLDCPPEEVHISIYQGSYTNEYGYSASMNGIWYSLLFAKGDIDTNILDKFAGILKDKKGVTVKKWKRFTGTTARFPKLYDGNLIFAGTASGFIDPAQGYGIISAMLGGKIASVAVTDRDRAQAEYDKFVEPVKKHVQLKFQPGYKSSIHYRMGQVWLDIPTIKPRVPDYLVKE
jgi:hypothetical protein